MGILDGTGSTTVDANKNENSTTINIESSAIGIPAGSAGSSLDDLLSNLGLSLPPDEGDEDKQESEMRVPIAVFKHKKIRQFKVGEHHFLNHLLYVYDEATLVSFLQAFAGLLPQDKLNIVKLNLAAMASLESPVDTASRAIIGAISTKQIKDPKSVQ